MCRLGCAFVVGNPRRQVFSGQCPNDGRGQWLSAQSGSLGGTLLYPWARYFILCLVLVQPRKCSSWLKNCWLGCKASMHTKQLYMDLFKIVGQGWKGIRFLNNYNSPAHQRWWYTLVNFHWARVRFGPVPLASCGLNGSGVHSPTAVSFTVLSQTPRQPTYFQNSISAWAMLIYFGYWIAS